MPTEQGFDAILFDVGGVLLTNGWDHTERQAAYAHFGLNEAEVAEIEARHAGPYDLLERDALTLDEFLAEVIFFKARGFTAEDFQRVMLEQSKLLGDSGLAVLRELAGHGDWLLGLLNNESRALHQFRMDRFGIAAYVDVQLSSCYLGLRKPEAAMYQRAVDILGCGPERILFIDDRTVNTSAAEELGITAIVFTGEASLRLRLAELGVV